ncbi:unnamed protein product, partial [Musa hybrid cultivar]
PRSSTTRISHYCRPCCWCYRFSITCSSCSTRPDGLLDIRGINTFSPHAHLTTNDQFLLLRRGDVCKGLIHV